MSHSTYDNANKRTYVTNQATISVIDPKTNTITDTISIGSFIYGMAYDPSNEDIVVAVQTHYCCVGHVSVFDSASKLVTNITGFRTPNLFAFNPLNKHVFKQ